MRNDSLMCDVIIIGGGVSGLSAALMLGRCRRRVVVCDGGNPRNRVSHALHGFLTRDGIDPGELLRVAREQLTRYGSVEIRDIEVTDAIRFQDRFEITLSDGSHLTSRKLLLATGIVDQVPDLEGIKQLYGRSVFHCPYCDGWEMRDQPIAIYGRGERGHGLALMLTAWSDDLILCTDGTAGLSVAERAELSRHGIRLREERIARLEGTNGSLERIVFTNGDAIVRRALFFNTGQQQRSDLPVKLGCKFTDKGGIQAGNYEVTTIPGLYVAGDASRDVQLAIVAAAEGVEAAIGINKALLKEDLK